MKLRTILVTAVAATLTLALAGTASASHMIWQQDFTDGTTDWSAAVTDDGDGTATAEDGAFSRFGAYRSVWPGDNVAEIDVYLDPAWADGSGFDYAVAANGADGAHQRDFIFHAGVVAGELLVTADNNSYGSDVNSFILTTKSPITITDAGSYTLQHRFYDNGGILAVDMNVLDSGGDVLGTWTLSNAADAMAEVGGNRYAWFIFVDVVGGLGIDNHELYLDGPHDPVTKDDCKNGGHVDFGFSEQGQCIKFLQTGQDSR
jgi:hypothetical protein